MTPEHKPYREKVAAMVRPVFGRVIALVGPRKTDEDGRQMEIVLNTILVSSIGLLVLLFATIVYNSAEMADYNGVTVSAFSLIILFFVMLFVASRRGLVRLASYGIVAAYFLGSFYCGYRWGASLPATLLSFSLVIVMANLLLGMRRGFLTMFLSFAALIYLSVHEMDMPEIIAWKNDPIELTDIIAYLFIIAFMFALSWVSRRQTDHSLARARQSERELEKERDSLEVKVKERTLELAKTQEDRLRELGAIAEFGRLSQGLFHDLLSPLSSMLLNVERMSAIPREEVRDVRDSLEKVSSAGKRFGAYLSSIRSAIGAGSAGTECSFEEELGNVRNLLSFKIRERSITIARTGDAIGDIAVGPMKIHQILLNLISNSIDSYDGTADGRDRVVTVEVQRERGGIRIAIRDNGAGIAKGDLPRIFEPFFTTKGSGLGTGIGLATVRRILDEIKGTISMESEIGKGTTATVRIPL